MTDLNIEKCDLRGTGPCGCPTACKVNMAQAMKAPEPIYCATAQASPTEPKRVIYSSAVICLTEKVIKAHRHNNPYLLSVEIARAIEKHFAAPVPSRTL